MQLRSLGLSSDLAMINGEILDRGNYLVVRSPEEQNFYWGNLLVFAEPPAATDLQAWEAIFASEFQDLVGVRHRTFAWDMSETAGHTSNFAAAGYRVEQSLVLTATELNLPRHPNRDIAIRTLQSEDDWRKLEDFQVECRDIEHEEEHYRSYVVGRLKGYRKRIDAGEGEWYAAFRDDRQIASLGIFRSGSSARFQVVITHADSRRQGVCGSLVHHVARRTLDRPEIHSLVMVADAEYHAARIYESLGFAKTETLVGLCKWPT
jgi:hypothetical protein